MTAIEDLIRRVEALEKQNAALAYAIRGLGQIEWRVSREIDSMAGNFELPCTCGDKHKPPMCY